MTPSQMQRVLWLYAALLVGSGVASYFLGRRHAPIALLGGLGGGALIAALSYFYRRRALWSQPALVTAVGVFTLSFLWRGIEAWHAGLVESALVLGVLAVVSIPVFVALLRMWR